MKISEVCEHVFLNAAAGPEFRKLRLLWEDVLDGVEELVARCRRLLVLNLHLAIQVPADQHIGDLEDASEFERHTRIVLLDTDELVLDGEYIALHKLLVVVDAFCLHR